VRNATTAGLLRTGPGVWVPCGRPEYLRQQCELSLRRLGQDALDLFQLHRIDPTVPAEDQFALLASLLEEGKVRAIGLSQVAVGDLEAARRVVPVATVQNLYNVLDRSSEDVLEVCERDGIAFIPWYPVAAGRLTGEGTEIDGLARDAGLSVAQVSLAWLLARSPSMLPIPGTSSVAHLEENCATADVVIDATTLARLEALSQ
jgi:aryl-alcohol dehydrogenase-like predicted oxidoreductase